MTIIMKSEPCVSMRNRHPMNPMNEFLYAKLVQTRKSLREPKIQAIYDRILASLSRYPLPILSAAQAKYLEGVSDKMAAYLGNLVQINYLRHFQTKEALARMHTRYVEECTRRTEREQPKENEFPIPQESTMAEKDSFDDYCFKSSLPKKRPNECDESEGKPSKKRQTICPVSSKGKFLPEENSNAWAILLAMLHWQNENGKKYVAKREIKEAYNSLSQKHSIEWKITNWEAMKQLLKNEYVVSFAFDIEKFALTEAGEDLAKSLMEAKIQSETEPEKEIEIKAESLLPREEEIALVPDYAFSIKGSEILSSKLWLYINNAESNHNSERARIFNELSDCGINCFLRNLPIGDFVWVLEVIAKGKQDSVLLALDHIVERKAIDAVASSIIDGRFSYHQYRLKASGFSNVHYVLEGKVPKGGVLLSTVLSSQLVNGFSLKNHSDVGATISFLKTMTFLLQANINSQIQSNSTLSFPSTFESFVLKNERTLVTVNNLFRDMIKAVKGLSSENVNTILGHFKTPLSLYEKLMSFESLEEVINYFNTSGGKGRKRIILKEADQSIKTYSKILSILFTQTPYPTA